MFTSLLIVAVGLLAPLALGFFPRVRLAAVVLEILLGIVIGPAGLGWAKPDAAVSILAVAGLAFLLFLSGLEIDVDRLRGRIVAVTALGFAVSFVIAILIGIGLRAGGLVNSPLFVAIVLAATSLGVVFPAHGVHAWRRRARPSRSGGHRRRHGRIRPHRWRLAIRIAHVRDLVRRRMASSSAAWRVRWSSTLGPWEPRRRKRLDYTPWFRRSPDPIPRCTRPSA
jgi:Sodium/hydrogen exchanger family